MAGPPRHLVLDVTRFESHVKELLGSRPHAIIDMRADAYGLTADLVISVLRDLGASEFLFDNTPLKGAGEYDVISGEELLGLAQGKPGFTTFSGTVINVKRVPAGRRISYGYTYETTGESTVALVALGYADGVLRRSSSRCPVRIGSATGIIAGRVAMDQFVVDLGDGEAQPGDTAVLWGNPVAGNPSIADWSRLTGVPGVAIHSTIGPRVTRSLELSVAS